MEAIADSASAGCRFAFGSGVIAIELRERWRLGSWGVEIRGLFWCVNEVHIRHMKLGYARVSTDGQSVEAQVRQLIKAGCRRVLRETASGAKSDRGQLRKALDQLEAGDLLMVTRLGRLARSTRDLLNTLATITERKAGFRSLGDTWADTTSARTAHADGPRRPGRVRA
jgi:Resolvase, N terminal domain